MSRLGQMTLKCPECSNDQPFTYWQIVNVTSDPDLKNKILDRTLFDQTCDRCGFDAEVDHSLLYHDVDRRLMVFLGKEAPNEFPTVVRRTWVNSDSDTRFRLVSSITELVEKILIWDAGLHDWVVEFVKLMRLEGDDYTLLANGAKLFFSRVVREGGFEVQLDFDLVSDSGKMVLSVPFGEFLRFAAEAYDRLPAGECEARQWLRVDREYVLEILENDDDESDSDSDDLYY